MKNTAIIILNLGSPNSASVSDVRRYLAQFLMDKYVLDVPAFLRFILVYLLILPTRPKKSAEAYASIWDKDGSPLILNSERFTKKFKSRVDVPVELAMRYGSPSIESVMNKLMDMNPDLERLVVYPMYPHYAMSSTKTGVEECKRVAAKLGYRGIIDVIPSFYNRSEYISVLTESIRPKINDKFDYLLFSYHGLPERHLRKTDPTGSWCLETKDCCEKSNPEVHATCYRHQCYETTRLVAEKLGLESSRYGVSFQSRLGRDPWLQPYTDKVIAELPDRGIKRLHVVCPAFVADCLETLEEIEGEAAEIFHEAKGSEFTYIPCLNDSDAWVDASVQILNSELGIFESH